MVIKVNDLSSKNCYNNRNYEPGFVGSFSIKLLTELHNIDTLLTKCRSYRWRRVCLSGRNLKFYIPIVIFLAIFLIPDNLLFF